MTLHRLLYLSRCTFRETGPERAAAVRALATRSSARNAQVGLTGTLLHIDDKFVQVLEGPAAAVERTFEAICCDFRHEDVKLIDLVPVKEALFPEWSMAYLGAGEAASVKLRGDLEEVHFLVTVNAREAIDQMRRLLTRDAVPA